MDELLARFLPRFTAQARTRLAHAVAAVTRRDFGAIEKVAHELHTLAGEAGLLGLIAIVPIARDGEIMARQLCATQTDEDAPSLIAILDRLAAAVERVEVAPQVPTESA